MVFVSIYSYKWAQLVENTKTGPVLDIKSVLFLELKFFFRNIILTRNFLLSGQRSYCVKAVILILGKLSVNLFKFLID